MKTKKQIITKEELDKVSEKWLDEQDPETFDNPITRFGAKDEGKFDAEADAKQWASSLPDKNTKPFEYGFVTRTSN